MCDLFFIYLFSQPFFLKTGLLSFYYSGNPSGFATSVNLLMGMLCHTVFLQRNANFRSQLSLMKINFFKPFSLESLKTQII